MTYAPIPIPVGNPVRPWSRSRQAGGSVRARTSTTLSTATTGTRLTLETAGREGRLELDVLAAGQYEVTVTYAVLQAGDGRAISRPGGDDASLTVEVKPTSNAEVFERSLWVRSVSPRARRG